MDLQGHIFSDTRDPILFDSREPMTIFAASRDPSFNSRDLNRVFKSP